MNEDARANPSMAALAYLNSSVAGPGVGVDQADISFWDEDMARIKRDVWAPYSTPSGDIHIDIYGVADPAPTGAAASGMAADAWDNSGLRVIGQSGDGGLIWNTRAILYVVPSPDIEVRPLPDAVVAGTGLKLPGSTWQSDFMRGYWGEYRSVMEGPAPAIETAGRFAGETVDAFKNFGLSATGAGSMNAAIASWQAGNYGASALRTVQAFGEAGMTVFGIGSIGSTARYGAMTTAV